MEQQNWKQKTLIIGIVVGALTGLLASHLLIQRAEKENTNPHLSAGEGVKLGMGLMALMKTVVDFGSGK